MKTQDIPLFSSFLGHGNSHFRRKITIIPPEFPFFKIVRCTTIVTHLWLMSRSRALPSLPPPSLPPSFFCFRFRQQDVRCWWTTVYNVIVQQRTRIHAAKEYFTRGWQGFHSGKRKKKKKRERKEREKKQGQASYSRVYTARYIYISGAMFIGSENDRGEISGARLKIHHALSRGSFAKYSMELFPTSYIPSSILSNHPLLHTLLPLDSRFRPEIIALALPTW